jgi:hypothetical protein
MFCYNTDQIFGAIALRLTSKSKKSETAEQAAKELEDCQAEIKEAGDVARAGLQTREALLIDGTIDQIRSVESQIDAAELRKEIAQARLPGIAARLNELRAAEAKVRLAGHLAHLESALPDYLKYAQHFAAAAQAALHARNELAREFPMESLGVPNMPPLVLDLGACNGTTPSLRLATGVYEFVDGAARAIAALKRKLS